MRILIFAFALVLTAFAAPQAQAQQVVQCGIPDKPVLDTNPDYQFCDIYQRRFAYIKESDALGEMLAERQKNYNAIRKQALDQYEQELEAYHNSKGE